MCFIFLNYVFYIFLNYFNFKVKNLNSKFNCLQLSFECVHIPI